MFEAIPANATGTFFVWYVGAAIVGYIFGYLVRHNMK